MSDDLISRQAVKNKYKESLIHNLTDNDRGIDLSKYAEEPYKAFCEFIDSIPSVNPQPKTGHWIKYGIPRCEEQHYQCTNCDYYINFGKWGELYTKEFKYCPNCGAKMQEVEEWI